MYIIIKAYMKEKNDEVIKTLTVGKWYLKGEYISYCAANESSEIPDHCHPFALPNPKETFHKYQ